MPKKSASAAWGRTTTNGVLPAVHETVNRIRGRGGSNRGKVIPLNAQRPRVGDLKTAGDTRRRIASRQRWQQANADRDDCQGRDQGKAGPGYDTRGALPTISRMKGGARHEKVPFHEPYDTPAHLSWCCQRFRIVPYPISKSSACPFFFPDFFPPPGSSVDLNSSFGKEPSIGRTFQRSLNLVNTGIIAAALLNATANPH